MRKTHIFLSGVFAVLLMVTATPVLYAQSPGQMGPPAHMGGPRMMQRSSQPMGGAPITFDTLDELLDQLDLSDAQMEELSTLKEEYEEDLQEYSNVTSEIEKLKEELQTMQKNKAKPMAIMHKRMELMRKEQPIIALKKEYFRRAEAILTDAQKDKIREILKAKLEQKILDHVIKVLDLTDEQVEQVGVLRENLDSELEKYAQNEKEIQQLRQEIHVLTATLGNASLIQEKRDKIQQLYKPIQEARKKFFADFRDILTEEQKKKLDEVQQRLNRTSMNQPPLERRLPGGNLLANIDLTPEQQEKIKGVHQEIQPQLDKMQDNLQKLRTTRQEIGRLLETGDTEPIRDKLDLVKSLNDENRSIMETLHDNIAEVLTEEQNKIFQENIRKQSLPPTRHDRPGMRGPASPQGQIKPGQTGPMIPQGPPMSGVPGGPGMKPAGPAFNPATHIMSQLELSEEQKEKIAEKMPQLQEKWDTIAELQKERWGLMRHVPGEQGPTEERQTRLKEIQTEISSARKEIEEIFAPILTSEQMDKLKGFISVPRPGVIPGGKRAPQSYGGFDSPMLFQMLGLSEKQKAQYEEIKKENEESLDTAHENLKTIWQLMQEIRALRQEGATQADQSEIKGKQDEIERLANEIKSIRVDFIEKIKTILDDTQCERLETFLNEHPRILDVPGVYGGNRQPSTD